jgi:multiple sugar transport system substrate-binding protein
MGDKEFSDTWGLAQIPMPPEGKRVSTAGGWTVAVFTKDDQKRKLAADFAISLFIDDEAMDEYSAVSGNLPCRSTIYEKSEYFKNDPVLVAYANELEYARVRPGVEIYPAISQEFQVAISDVITGAASPEVALRTMAQNISN